MRLVFIGTGYVGLVSGVCFADLDFDVTCVDIDADKISRLQQGQVPIFEPGLEDLLQKNIAAGRLRFTTDLANSVLNADIVFVAVGTPCLPDSDAVDLSQVFAAVDAIAPHLTTDALLVVKSTVPPGTCQKISEFGCNVVANPEFLREGAAVNDFMHPDRIVIGTTNEHAQGIMQQLYTKIAAPVVSTDLETAELIKYTANAFLAMKVAFINEVADICEKIGADAQQVAYGIGLDQRIGKQFLQPGPGFGGSCFPKDIRALQDFSQTVLAPSKLVQAVITANSARIQNCVDKIVANCAGSVKGKRIAVLGLAFKASTDDIRESPAVHLVQALLEAGAKVRAYDPAAMANAARHFAGAKNLEFCEGIASCMQAADALVIATEWPQFKNLNPQEISVAMREPIIIDLRNLYDNNYFAEHNIRYSSIGRPSRA